MQTLELKVNIPDEYVILKRDEMEELQNKVDQRVWIGFNDLKALTSIERNKLDTILKRYRSELDVHNGGPVKFPDGGKWSFEKEGIRQWLKVNHSRIWKEDETKEAIHKE